MSETQKQNTGSGAESLLNAWLVVMLLANVVLVISAMVFIEETYAKTQSNSESYPFIRGLMNPDFPD